ncbi:MAG TPA: hypothetical protein VNM14_16970 [Planctomycetota bacterium]|nr:hypothetical protein [Planctomycetota bacterium]
MNTLWLALVLVLAPQEKETDLLKLIDVDRDAIVGEWKQADGVLASPAVRQALLQIPYLPPREYDLSVDAELRGEPESLNLGLVAEGRQFMVVLNGWNGRKGGVHLVAGKDAASNETTFDDGLLKQGVPTTIVCSVRKDRLTVRVGSETVLNWPTDYANVSNDDHWASRDSRLLYIGSYATSYRIRRLRLLPVSGEGRAWTDPAFLSRRLGVSEGAPFDDLAPPGGFLVGVRASVGDVDGPVIKSLAPIYRIGEQTRGGPVIHGRPSESSVDLVAPPGYAVSGIVARAGGLRGNVGWDRIYGFRLSYLKISGDKLDPQDRQSSEWVGRKEGPPEITIDGQGRKVMGLYGRHGENLDALGLIYAADPADTLLAAAAPRKVHFDRHVLSYLGGGFWLEEMPNGERKSFRTLGRDSITPVPNHGVSGTVLQHQETGLFLLLPDKARRGVFSNWLFLRDKVHQPWRTFQEMKSIDPVRVRPTAELKLGADVSLEQASRIMEEAAELPPEQLKVFEAELAKDPGSLGSRLRLMGYHGRRGGEGAQSQGRYADLVVGLVEQHATLDLAFELSRWLQPPSFEKAAAPWIAAARAHPADARILGNAGAYLTSSIYVADFRDQGKALLQQARKLDPKNPRWALALGEGAETEFLTDRSKETAARALGYLEEAYALTPAANRAALRPQGCHLFHVLAKLAFTAGDLKKAETYATDLLKVVNEKEEEWNYGNAIHDGNTVLGQVALRNGNREQAKKFLLASGQTPGSPQLNSFGPEFTLAKELLEKEERATVLQYFELCRKFWNNGAAIESLDDWTKMVKEGKVPDFGRRGE